MADEFTAGSPDGGGGQPTSGGTDGPAPITLTDDARFVPPGGKEPVTWKDYSSGFVSKADLTRMRQQDAVALKTREDALKQQEAQLQRASQQLAGRLQPAQSQTDPIAELANAPYVEGKVVANLVQALRGELAKRDQAMGLLEQRLQQVSQGFTSIQGRNQQSEQQALFADAAKAAGLPDNDHVKGLIESEYWAHDGWDTVTPPERVAELSRIVKQRYDGLVQGIRALDKERVDKARQTPIAVRAQTPKLNGQGKALGQKSAEALATELWPMIQPGTQT